MLRISDLLDYAFSYYSHNEQTEGLPLRRFLRQQAIAYVLFRFVLLRENMAVWIFSACPCPCELPTVKRSGQS